MFRLSFDIEHTVVDGGSTRFESSLNGLKAIDGGANDYVAIHDGVRPLVSKDTIQRCFDAVLGCKAVIPVVKVVDSLRKPIKMDKKRTWIEVLIALFKHRKHLVLSC